MYEELDPKLWEKRGSSLGSQDAIKTLFTGSSSENSGSEIYDVDDKKKLVGVIGLRPS